MYFLYNDQNIYYDIVGDGDVLIMLHGWGVNSRTFDDVKAALKNQYQIITIDFLGFGMSDEPNQPLTLDDYVECLQAFICQLQIKDPIILGHSFGGRVAIKYCLINHIKQLILVDSAGIKHQSFIVKLKIIKYKLLKNYYKVLSKNKFDNLITNSGSQDYKNASAIMKRTMSNVINVNLKKDIKKIQFQTLILWGYNDKVTPFKDAVYFNQNIKDSRLIIFYHSGHFPYIEEKKKFIQVLINGGKHND